MKVRVVSIRIKRTRWQKGDKMLIKYKKQEDREKKTSEKRNDKNEKEKKNKKTGFD